MRKSPPKSSGYESDEHVAAAATTLAYQARYGDKEDKEEEEEEEKEEEEEAEEEP